MRFDRWRRRRSHNNSRSSAIPPTAAPTPIPAMVVLDKGGAAVPSLLPSLDGARSVVFVALAPAGLVFPMPGRI